MVSQANISETNTTNKSKRKTRLVLATSVVKMLIPFMFLDFTAYSSSALPHALMLAQPSSKLPNTHQLVVETRADNRPLPALLPALNGLHVTSVVHALVLLELRQHPELPLA